MTREPAPDVVVRDGTREREHDIDRILGGRRSAPDSCWCRRFLGASEPDNRTAFHRELRTGAQPVGLVAYRDGEPAGWSRVAPRASLPGILSNRALARILDDPDGAWWVTCFTILPTHRGHGVGQALLGAAIDLAARSGGRVLDGHPVDVAAVAGRPSPSALFTGTLATFHALGFAEIGRTYPTRPVMRRHLTDGSAPRRPAAGRADPDPRDRVPRGHG